MGEVWRLGPGKQGRQRQGYIDWAKGLAHEKCDWI